MTQFIGGLRARLIHDNIYHVVRDGLDELGWLAPSQDHKPVEVRSYQVGDNEKVEPNIVCVTVEDDHEDPAEMGSLLTDFSWTYYIDVYGEDEQWCLHLAKDIKDIMGGRFSSSVSRGGPTIGIYDLTQSYATPVQFCTVDIEDVAMDRARFFDKEFERYWRVVSFTVKDTYGTEEY